MMITHFKPYIYSFAYGIHCSMVLFHKLFAFMTDLHFPKLKNMCGEVMLRKGEWKKSFMITLPSCS